MFSTDFVLPVCSPYVIWWVGMVCYFVIFCKYVNKMVTTCIKRIFLFLFFVYVCTSVHIYVCVCVHMCIYVHMCSAKFFYSLCK